MSAFQGCSLQLLNSFPLTKRHCVATYHIYKKISALKQMVHHNLYIINCILPFTFYFSPFTILNYYLLYGNKYYPIFDIIAW